MSEQMFVRGVSEWTLKSDWIGIYNSVQLNVIVRWAVVAFVEKFN